MAIGSLPPVINEIQANSGQPGKTLAQQSAASSLLDLQAASTAEPATAILPETTLIEKAVAEALGRQGGLAPLYATLAELVDSPDLPDAVKAAVKMVLAFRVGDGDVTAERVAEAIRSSGVFHEAVAAGKMAAALSPAIRQALAGTPEDRQQLVARTVALAPTAPMQTTRPISPSPSSSAPNAPPPATAQAYARQGGMAASAGAAISQAVASGSAVGPTVISGGPNGPVVAAPASSQVILPTNAAVAAEPPSVPSASPGAVSMPSAPASGPTATQSGKPQQAAPTATPAPALPVAEAPLPPATTGMNGASPAQAIPSPEQVTSQPITSPQSGAPPSSPPLASSGTATPTIAAQVTAPSLAASSGAGLTPATSQPPAPTVPDTQSSASLSPTTASAPSPSPTTASRSFAPWVPGRPLISAAQATAAPPSSSPPPVAGRSASVPSSAPGDVSSQPAVARPTGDRAPFVPSTVESLPDTPSGQASPRASVGQGAAPPAPGTQTQPGGQPGVAAPLQSGSVQSPAIPAPSLQPPASPDIAGARSDASAAVPVRPGTPIVGSAPPSPVRQVPLPAALQVTGAPPALGVDLKGALDVLRRELLTWLGRNADVMASLDGAADDMVTARSDRPSPPRKNGPVRGQPAVKLPDGSDDAAGSTEALAGRALGEAERSLSRVFLHQAATAENRDVKAAHPAQALMLEIPIAGPNGTSIAQLRIERDDHAPSEPGAPPRRVFQVDIAFDIAPLGPVAVRVGLMDGRRVAVGVWCESDDGLVRMEAERENIVLGLEQEGMTVAGVDLHRGHPPEGQDETAAASSHRLDLQL